MCTPSPKGLLGPTSVETAGGDRSVQMGVSWLVGCSFCQLQSLHLETYTTNVENNELGPCGMQEREVASLGLLLKIQEKGFCVIHFLLKKRHKPTQLVPTNST